MWSELNKTTQQREIDSAKVELLEAKAVKLLLTSDTLAAEIHISGMRIGLCEIKWLIPVVNKQIKELEKFLKGEDNSWE